MKNMTNAEYKAFMLEGTKTGKLATVRTNGRPHVVPIWFTLDGDDILFMTMRSSVKTKNMLHNPRVAISVDHSEPPYHFVLVEGKAIFDDVSMDELLKWSTQIGGRYMGAERAEEYGKRNATPDEALIRVKVDKIIAQKDLAE